MIATIRETISSLQDKYYGQRILSLPLKDVVWYWTKYLLLIFLISLLFSVGFITYVVPQIPPALRMNFPEGEVNFRDGRLSSTADQPVTWGNQDFALILDTSGRAGDLDNYSSGILFLSDRYLIKDPQTGITENSYTKVPDFSISKSGVVEWVNSNQVILWLIFLLIAIVLSIIFFAGLFVFRMLTFLVWAIVFWLAGKLFKKSLTYLSALKIIIYASVLPLILSVLQSLVPSELFSLLSLVLFLFFGFLWLLNLPPAHPQSAPPSPPALPPVKKSRKRRSG